MQVVKLYTHFGIHTSHINNAMPACHRLGLDSEQNCFASLKPRAERDVSGECLKGARNGGGKGAFLPNTFWHASPWCGYFFVA